MKSAIEICEMLGLPERAYPAGAVLMAEGERSGKLLVLRSGTIEIVKEEVELAVLSSPGSLLGEVSVLLDEPHMATVRAVEDTVCHEVEDGAGLLRDHPEFAHPIALLLARRLKSITAYLVDIQRQFADQDDHLGMVDEVLESLIHHQSPGDTEPPGR